MTLAEAPLVDSVFADMTSPLMEEAIESAMPAPESSAPPAAFPKLALDDSPLEAEAALSEPLEPEVVEDEGVIEIVDEEVEEASTVEVVEEEAIVEEVEVLEAAEEEPEVIEEDLPRGGKAPKDKKTRKGWFGR